MIHIKNLSKTYPLGKKRVIALRHMTLDVPEGCFLTVIGASGSGKSTLLGLMGGLDRPDTGSMIIGGKNIDFKKEADLTHLRRFQVAMIFQSFNLIPFLNVFENVTLPFLFRKEKPQGQAIRDIIADVGLSEFMDHKPEELSGGQQQRVAIARALAGSPKVILADEPTANLDSETSIQILNLMKHLNELKKTTFVVATHDPLVAHYATESIKLSDGKILTPP